MVFFVGFILSLICSTIPCQMIMDSQSSSNEVVSLSAEHVYDNERKHVIHTVSHQFLTATGLTDLLFPEASQLLLHTVWHLFIHTHQRAAFIVELEMLTFDSKHLTLQTGSVKLISGEKALYLTCFQMKILNEFSTVVQCHL